MAKAWQILMPSIYPDSFAASKKKRSRLKASCFVAAICAFLALSAASLMLIVFVHSRAPNSVQNEDNNVIVTYVKKSHPRQLVASSLEPEDVFISVKTTRSNHQTRLDSVISTWYQLARDHTYFFTDASDEDIEAKVTGGHLVVTSCGSSHSRQDLCCKMGAEFDAFFDSDKRWFCHFDDDNYVNVPRLVETLSQFDPRQDWYLGKPSLPEPLEIPGDRDTSTKESVRFWFATGGAGFCVSKSLAGKMMPLIGGGKFESVGEKIRLPDDVTTGYVVEHLLQVPLTVVQDFHSHIEALQLLPNDAEKLAQGISYSYKPYSSNGSGDQPLSNVLNIQVGFSPEDDPTRFKSLHCSLFPNFSWCPRS